jgi:GT2 family glycosyltransferase
MISIVYCTRETKPEHKEHLIKSSGLDKKIEVIEIINKGNESLTKAYNRGLKEAKNDLVVFCHDDIDVLTKQWGSKLIKAFKKHSEFCIIGVAGSKNLPTSGKWWENPKKMYGRVAHTHEGKTWLSAYSDDLGQDIEEVVVVDGVFFAVDKTKLKKSFDDSVDGFHFYDVTFCFQNFLEGVKIGVTTQIRINHQSIGVTNESWENNRVEFSNKNEKNLPLDVKKVLRKGEKLKILLTALSFDDTSPKSSIILDLATKLRKENHDVTLCANMQGKMPMLAKQKGIKLSPIQQPPGFALGDGKWKMNTPNGEIISQPNTLYKVKDFNYHVIHTFDNELIEHMNKVFPNSNIVNTSFNNALLVNESNPLVKVSITLDKSINTNNVLDKYAEAI